MSNIHSLLTTGTFKGSRQNAVRCGTAGGPIKAALRLVESGPIIVAIFCTVAVSQQDACPAVSAYWK